MITIGDTTYRLTTKQKVVTLVAEKRLLNMAVCPRNAPPLDTIIAQLLDDLDRADLEMRAIDFAGGW